MRTTLRLSLLGLCLATLALAQSETPLPTRSVPTAPASARVLRVIDADTIEVAGVGSVRLMGIDAPEPSAPHGPQSAAALENMLLGEDVTLTPAAGEPDLYGRGLAFVRRMPDGLDVNLEMVRQGYARVGKPPFDGYAEFSRWERRARDAGRGLWGHKPPPDWHGLTLEEIPGMYRMAGGEGGDHVLILQPDHWFRTGEKAIPQYQWELTPDGLVVKFFSARWVFQPVGGGAFAGTYTGPSQERLGEAATLVRLAEPRGTVTTPPPPEPKPVVVYVTETGTKYHRAGCRHLRRSRTPMRLEDAKSSGYEPCAACAPPE